MPRDGPPRLPAGALSNKNIENSMRVTAQRSRPPKLPNGIFEIPNAIGQRQIDTPMRERERGGKREMEKSNRVNVKQNGVDFCLA